jgi:hypothetical protein
MASATDPGEIEHGPTDERANEPSAAHHGDDDATSEGHSMSIIQGGPDPRTLTRERRREIEEQTSGRRTLGRIRERDR